MSILYFLYHNNIGSLFLGLTSLSTTLRAVGKSRECGGNNIDISHGRSSGENINLYLISTMIWYCISLLLLVPFITDRSVLFLILHIIILLIIGLFWRDIKARAGKKD